MPKRPGVCISTLPVICIKLTVVVAGGGFSER